MLYVTLIKRNQTYNYSKYPDVYRERDELTLNETDAIGDGVGRGTKNRNGVLVIKYGVAYVCLTPSHSNMQTCSKTRRVSMGTLLFCR